MEKKQRAIKRTFRKATPEQIKKNREVRKLIEEEKEELFEEARVIKAITDGDCVNINKVFPLLRKIRRRKEITLADIEEASDISVSSLSRLENTEDNNPKISTLERYADAIGKELFIVVKNKKT